MSLEWHERGMIYPSRASATERGLIIARVLQADLSNADEGKDTLVGKSDALSLDQNKSPGLCPAGSAGHSHSPR